MRKIYVTNKATWSGLQEIGLSVVMFALFVGNLEHKASAKISVILPVALEEFIFGTEAARLDFLILILFLMWENRDFGGGGGGGGGGISGLRETSF